MDGPLAAIVRALLDPGDTTERLEAVTTGMSGASVVRVMRDGVPDRFVKIADADAAAALRDEVTRTNWLAARNIQVPRILRTREESGHFAALMEAVPGRPADANALPVPQLVEALAGTLVTLHALPSGDCPFDETLSVRLARAAEAVDAGDIEIAEFDVRNRDVAPEMLLARLIAQQPAEDIVVVHGDATLSNIMVDERGTAGFIDCGRAGRGDRYLDLGVLEADIAAHYGAEAAAHFARCYGVAWNTAKALYYSDLYEFF